MKIINIDGNDYKIPESWQEINLKQFITFMDLLHSGSSDDYTILYQISAFCNIELDKVKKMNSKFLPEFLNVLEFLQFDPDLKPVSNFIHIGTEYSIIDHILNSETQDFISLMGIQKDNEKTPWRSLPIKMAILSKKKLENGTKESIDDYDIKQRANEFLNLPITTVKSIDSFFLLASMMSSLDSLTFLKSQNEEILELIKSYQNILRHPVGTGWFGKWQMRMFAKYLKYIEKGWNKFYFTTLSRQEKVK